MGNSINVLVIDDEKGVTQLCQRLLERSGYHVITALSAHDGLELLEQHTIDLLVLDIRMPVMDGFQVIQLARKRHPDLAILIITGHGTIELALEALHHGADGLALKPFTADEFYQSVAQAIEQNQLKREMSRLNTLQPLFEFSNQLFRELTPSRLRRLVVESICKHLSCQSSLVINLPTTRKPSQSRLAVTIQKHLFYRTPTQDVHAERERAQTLATMVLQSIHDQQVSQTTISTPHGEQQLMVSPAAMRVPAQTANKRMRMDSFAPMRRSHDAEQWLILAAIRTASSDPIAQHHPLPQSFSAADVDMLSILSHQAATAFENAVLTSELRAYIRKVKDSQRLLLQAEKMAASGRLMASIAHEINNPLQAVQNCIHLARRNDLHPENRQNYLEMAQNELERLTKTVQRMLDLYRPASFERQQTDLNLSLTRVLNLMKQRMKDNQIEVSLICDPELPKVQSIPDQIQQVFLNLLINAAEAMPNGGRLAIRTQAISKKWAEVLFHDDGPGVNPKIRKRIFEPFSSGKVGGTGLGLSISYEIITAHGGSLELIDNTNPREPLLVNQDGLRGACFRIRLPVA